MEEIKIKKREMRTDVQKERNALSDEEFSRKCKEIS